MKHRRIYLRSLGPLTLVGLSIVASGGRTARTAFQRSARNCCGTPEAPRELGFAYYSLRDGFQSTLNLVSNSPSLSP